MNRHLASRIITIVLFGVLFGSYIHRDYANWNLRGREAFLAHESQRFDRFIAKPHPRVFTVIGATITVAGIFGIYELIALGLSAALKAMDSGGGKT
jgi:hypothetical protein